MADNVRFLSGGIGNLDKQPITPGNIYFALSDDKTYGYIVYDFKDSDNSNNRIVMSAKAKTAGQVEFPLVIGEHSYDGSERIEIPIYDGSSESGSECFDISILDNMLVFDNDKIWLFKDGKIDKTAPVDFGPVSNESIKSLSDRLNNIESDYLNTTDKDQVVTMVSNEALERKAQIGDIGDKTVKEYVDDKTKLGNLVNYDDTEIRNELKTKLSQPSEAKVGQIFKVKTVNEDGTLALEAVDMTSSVFGYDTAAFHNSIVRGKDITSYYTDGTLWDRIAGTNGFKPYEDLYLGDYFKMSRAISAYEQTQQHQATGSQYVTIAGFDCMRRNGDRDSMNFNHITCVPGQFRSGTFYFGRSRMNPTNTTVGGYVGSEMYTTTIGEVATEGSTEATATINQQLYAEFGSHLKTSKELLSNTINASGYNRFGTNNGCSNSCSWCSCQAVLMSEVEVYGATVWSSSGFDTGTACMQLPLFAKDKACINNRSTYYWLKDVANASLFCRADGNGRAGHGTSNDATVCVRPRFNLA